MAEAILRNYDQNLEIYSAGIQPADHVSPVAKEVIRETGIKLQPHIPQHYSEYENMVFDYLITVGDGTSEELEIPSIQYKKKMHLGFHNPYKNSKNKSEIIQKCREIRDEIKIEMDYFYHRMLCK